MKSSDPAEEPAMSMTRSNPSQERGFESASASSPEDIRDGPEYSPHPRRTPRPVSASI